MNPSQNIAPSYFGVIAKSAFEAPWWAKNCHVQTIFPRFLQKRQALYSRRENFTLADGDFVTLVWAGETEKAKALVVMFHGLEGSVDSHYCQDTAASLLNAGYAVVVMHFRGCGGSPNLLPRSYHSGETSDPWEVLTWLEQRYPALPKFAIGFSLGGNVLLKLLGEKPEQTIIKMAMTVSAPLQLAECSLSLNKGFSKVYQRYLLNSMLSNLKQKMKTLDYQNSIKIGKNTLHKIKNVRDFDQVITAPLHGFKDADDYYAQCSGLSYLHLIRTPTLVIHAKDDPFMNDKVIPTAQQLSNYVRVELSERGGHVGFLQGSPWRPKVWLQQRACDFFSLFTQIHNNTEDGIK